MYYFVYKTTNIVNGKFYIGKHRCKDISKDNYLGSGATLKKAIRKYGKSSFVREILRVFETEDEALDYEAEIVTDELILNEMCYNETKGGRGSFHHINSDKTRINPMHKPEVVEKIREHYRVNGVSDKHRESSKSNIRKAISSNIGRKRPEHAKKVRIKSKEQWANNKEKMRDALSSWYLVTSPSGEEYRTNRLMEFCASRGWNPLTLYSKKARKRGPAAGWKATKMETNNEKHQ